MGKQQVTGKKQSGIHLQRMAFLSIYTKAQTLNDVQVASTKRHIHTDSSYFINFLNIIMLAEFSLRSKSHFVELFIRFSASLPSKHD